MNAAACTVCGGHTSLLDTLDFNRSCHPTDTALSGVTTDYVLCTSCGFCFAPEFQSWSSEDFSSRIYNADYIRFDPGYLESRPRANAAALDRYFGPFKHLLQHLDYGGGNGLTSQILTRLGWCSTNFDPYANNGSAAQPPLGSFNLITAYEVFEHVADIHPLMQTLGTLLAPQGVIFFSTMLSDGHVREGAPLSWWYAAPRNGHISLFSEKSLQLLAQAHGMHLHSFSAGLHAMWKVKPSWIDRLTQNTTQILKSDDVNRTVPTYQGPMICNRYATGVDASLLAYGEASMSEIQLLEQIAAPGKTAVQVGAGIGVHSVALSRRLGPTGSLVAAEANRLRFQALCGNLALNQCTNTNTFQRELGGSSAKNSLDQLALERCDLLVIHSAEGAAQILEGSQTTIQKLQPAIYINASRQHEAKMILALILTMDYRCWWHPAPWFNPRNHNGNPVNIFSNKVTVNIFCQPSSATRVVNGLNEITHLDDWWNGTVSDSTTP